MKTDLCKVLVVDDNRDAADSTAMLVNMWGHETRVAYSGEQCLLVARRFDPDVVLMDIGLPGENGIDVAKELAEICPGVRIVALSGFTQADIVRRTREAGFTDYLLKPVTGTELKDVVDVQCSTSRHRLSVAK